MFFHHLFSSSSEFSATNRYQLTNIVLWRYKKQLRGWGTRTPTCCMMVLVYGERRHEKSSNLKIKRRSTNSCLNITRNARRRLEYEKSRFRLNDSKIKRRIYSFGFWKERWRDTALISTFRNTLINCLVNDSKEARIVVKRVTLLSISTICGTWKRNIATTDIRYFKTNGPKYEE